MYYLFCLTSTVNANSLKHNIIVTKEIRSWLPPFCKHSLISSYSFNQGGSEEEHISLSWSKEGTVRHRQSKEASIVWSHHEETRELPGERDNARNNARCTQERGHARPGWTTSRRGQDSRWKSQSEWQRTGIGLNGESTSMVWPTVGSRTAKEQKVLSF